jgi:IclR family acetate operon transcriptional repressor
VDEGWHVEGARGGTLGTVRNAGVLLRLLSEGPPYQQLTDLAERSGLSLPTAHRLLRSLAGARLVEQDPRSQRYGLGSELVHLSERYLDRQAVLRAMAPYLVEIRNSTGHTALGALLIRGWVLYADRVDGEHVAGIYRESTRMRPALETAAGRLLAARAGDDVWREALSACQGNGRFTSKDRSAFARAPHLLVVEPHACWEAAVPLVAEDGRVLAAIGTCGDPARLDAQDLTDRVVPQLVRAAAAISRAVGDG